MLNQFYRTRLQFKYYENEILLFAGVFSYPHSRTASSYWYQPKLGQATSTFAASGCGGDKQNVVQPQTHLPKQSGDNTRHSYRGCKSILLFSSSIEFQSYWT
jgi:hypothetical protein